MALKINNLFKHRQIVYLIADSEQIKRMVVYICLYDEGLIAYGLSAQGELSEHYEFEITADKQVI